MKQLAAAAMALCTLAFVAATSHAAVVSFAFVVQVNTVTKNTGPLNVAVGDLLAAEMSVNLKTTEDTTPGGGWSIYSVGKGKISVSVDCVRFVHAIDEIDVMNDYPLGSTGEFLDRFFVNAGDVRPGSDGIQFWIDEQAVFPTLLLSRDIQASPLDLSKSTMSTFLVESADLEIQAHFLEFRDQGPSAS